VEAEAIEDESCKVKVRLCVYIMLNKSSKDQKQQWKAEGKIDFFLVLNRESTESSSVLVSFTEYTSKIPLFILNLF